MKILTYEQVRELIPHRDIALTIGSAGIVENGDGLDCHTVAFWLPKPQPYFVGHYPQKPILPGHWLLEFMCLALAVAVASQIEGSGGLPILAEVNGFQPKKMIEPEQPIRAEVKIIKANRRMVIGSVTAYVGEELVGKVSEIKAVLAKE